MMCIVGRSRTRSSTFEAVRCDEPRINPATRESVREWLARFDGVEEVGFGLEGTTGLTGPRRRAKRGRKRRAKTDRADCDLLLRLLSARELPE